VKELADVDTDKSINDQLQDERVNSLVTKFPTVFTDKTHHGGSDIRYEHEVIPLQPDARPSVRPMYRYSPIEQEVMQAEIKAQLEKGYIVGSSAPYGANVLFVKKPRSDKLRMCVDWRVLNSMTIKNKYPIPRIDDMLDRFAGKTIFSTLDLREAYHQIKLQPSDMPKTTFRTPFGSYMYTTLAMGLTNSPSAFQSIMNRIFATFVRAGWCTVYLDDICIASKSEEEHVQHIQDVLKLLEKEKLTVNIEKCQLFKPELLYVGHIISADGVRADPTKVDALTKHPAPVDVSGVRSFLGTTNYFRKYIKDYAQIAAPLTNLTKSSVQFQWDTKQQTAFQALKQAISEAPILRLPDWTSTEPFEIHCDASLAGIGGILMQGGRPIAFESRKLSGPELNYSVSDLEMLSVKHHVELWRCYIEGRQVHIFTDHKPNTTFSTNPLVTRRQARWTDALQGFDITFHYQQGKFQIADSLSRHPVHPAAIVAGVRTKYMRCRHICSIQTTKSVSAKNPTFIDQMKSGYSDDPYFQDIVNVEKLEKTDDIFYFENTIVVPNSNNLRTQVIKQYHSPPGAGHPGRDKVRYLVKKDFWWPNMDNDIAEFVKKCDSCQRNKKGQTSRQGLLQPLQLPSTPWESISMDFVVSLPETNTGFDQIIVFVDRLTKMVHLVPSYMTDTAVDIAHLYVANIVRLHGLSMQIVSDRDAKFTSKFWKTVMQDLGVDQAMSSAFHPQTDGNTERVNRVMEDMLRHYVKSDQTDWDKQLPMVEFAINNSKQESIQTTPFLLNSGINPHLPMNLLIRKHGLKRVNNKGPGGNTFQWHQSVTPGSGDLVIPSAKEFVNRMHYALEEAKACLRAAQQRQKAYADMKRIDINFDVNDSVLLSTKNITLKMIGTEKFLPKFIGPFLVSRKINAVAYELRLPPSMRIHNVFHVSLLKLYYPDGSVQPPPPPVLTTDLLNYEVEQILQHRVRDTVSFHKESNSRRVSYRNEYLCKWLNYGYEYNTWEPERVMVRHPEALREYWQNPYIQKASSRKRQKPNVPANE